MISKASKRVAKFVKKYSIFRVTEEKLLDIFEKEGYTVIEFSKFYNNDDVRLVIDNLGLNDYIQTHKGFTFANEKYRLVFVNADLSEEEKLMVLAHEQGHISCKHFSKSAVIGEDVKEEHEANEFTHYLLHPSGNDKTYYWFNKYKVWIIVAISAVLLLTMGITAFAIVKNKMTVEAQYYHSTSGEIFYVTESGTKYHKEDCKHVKSKTNIRPLTTEEYDSGKYGPCGDCLPDNE